MTVDKENMPDVLWCRMLNSGVHFSAVRDESPLIEEQIKTKMAYTKYVRDDTNMQPSEKTMKDKDIKRGGIL